MKEKIEYFFWGYDHSYKYLILRLIWISCFIHFIVYLIAGINYLFVRHQILNGLVCGVLSFVAIAFVGILQAVLSNI